MAGVCSVTVFVAGGAVGGSMSSVSICFLTAISTAISFVGGRGRVFCGGAFEAEAAFAALR